MHIILTHINRVLKKINPQLELKEPFVLKELSESLEQLSIMNPQGLFGGTECLTYVDKGNCIFLYLLS